MRPCGPSTRGCFAHDHGGALRAECDGEHALLATAFPKELGVQQGEVVENKRLSAVLDFIQKQQHERTEAKVAKPSTTLRKARLLRAGTPRRAGTGSSAETRP